MLLGQERSNRVDQWTSSLLSGRCLLAIAAAKTNSLLSQSASRGATFPHCAALAAGAPASSPSSARRPCRNSRCRRASPPRVRRRNITRHQSSSGLETALSTTAARGRDSLAASHLRLVDQETPGRGRAVWRERRRRGYAETAVKGPVSRIKCTRVLLGGQWQPILGARRWPPHAPVPSGVKSSKSSVFHRFNAVLGDCKSSQDDIMRRGKETRNHTCTGTSFRGREHVKLSPFLRSCGWSFSSLDVRHDEDSVKTSVLSCLCEVLVYNVVTTLNHPNWCILSTILSPAVITLYLCLCFCSFFLSLSFILSLSLFLSLPPPSLLLPPFLPPSLVYTNKDTNKKWIRCIRRLMIF